MKKQKQSYTKIMSSLLVASILAAPVLELTNPLKTVFAETTELVEEKTETDETEAESQEESEESTPIEAEQEEENPAEISVEPEAVDVETSSNPVKAATVGTKADTDLITAADLGNEQWLIDNVQSQTRKKVGVDLTFGDLKTITDIKLERRDVVGSIPTEIENLSNLVNLNLNSNEVSGSIPEGIGNLSKLTTLNLENNKLSGNIPEILGNLSNLTILNLYNNQLDGNIPDILANLSNLTNLDLRGNQLSGDIPKSLGNLSNLTNLNLGGNELSGSIPEELGNLSNLTILNLYFNQLSGNIPESLANLSNLKTLSFNTNQLSGNVPESLANLSNLTSLDLRTNKLSGSIPESLGNLTNLVGLYLSHNQLSGSIPDSLGNLSNLSGFSVYGNQLSGTIPESLGNLSNLKSLDIGRNQLSGTIPSSLGNLNNLDSFFFSYNKLIGIIPENLKSMEKISNSAAYDNQVTSNSNGPFDFDNGKNLHSLGTFINAEGSKLQLNSNSILYLNPKMADLKPFDSESDSYFNIGLSNGEELFEGHIYTIKDKATGEVKYSGEADDSVVLPNPGKATTYQIILDEADKNPNNITETRVTVQGPVKVEYKSEAGTEIAPIQLLEGEIGTPYTTSALDIEGWILKETPANANGTYTATEQTVTYIYQAIPTPYNTFTNGYWRDYGFILEGRAGIDTEKFSAEDSVTKKVEMLDNTGTIVKTWDAQNTNWYDATTYDGYQVILTTADMATLAAGNYTFQVEVTLKNGDKYVEAIQEGSSALGFIGEESQTIAGLENGIANSNEVAFSTNGRNVMQMNIASSTAAFNKITQYTSEAGTTIIDGWVAETSFNFADTHTKELVIENAEGTEVYREIAPTWDITETFGITVNDEWKRAGFQADIPQLHDVSENKAYIVVKNEDGTDISKTQIK
ncbi:leucine-rich repeat domain-containing protein [Carnobacterium gallinarum]|uniref:leucine-rich repeat domain-containing protein n=1 Tax=Carnobacterium gallinarum TaxID=2749 RepID=UPI0006924BDF|nr:MucBP domain-containing protein [Carnobacterium gallinarum]